ncbi:MAG TPA: hypothetical protein VFN26_13095 [Candidatus Acidoferrum sp.]|nr:hypothetical protein [Candidatus Acidoferrum sp.]
MKQKKELAILAVLLGIAAAVWLFYFQRDKQVATVDASSQIRNYQLLSVENPHIRIEKLEGPRKTEYKSAGRNIFTAAAPPPVEKPHVVQNHEYPTVKPPLPDPPPPPPTLPPNVKFFGYGTVPKGAARRAFFYDGEEVYVVPEGEILMNRFRLLRINNASVEFEEISTGRRGTAPLEEQGGPPSQ